MSNALETLTQINLDDLVDSFGWRDHPFLAGLLRGIFFFPAKKFATQMLEFDDAIRTNGLPDAARLSLNRYVRNVRIFHADRLPDSAFLALSNHPGLTDTIAAFSALNRKDLKIIALDRPFLKSLPETSKQLFFVSDDPSQRVALIRQVSAHLRSGGAALTFPAGHIEPDPEVYPGAIDSLKDWTDSVGIFIRLAPETAIVPILVRGVIWNKTAKHWILGIKKTKEEREKLAASLQLLAMMLFDAKPVDVTVQIGRPMTVKQLGTNDTQVIHQAVLKEMENLIREDVSRNE